MAAAVLAQRLETISTKPRLQPVNCFELSMGVSSLIFAFEDHQDDPGHVADVSLPQPVAGPATAQLKERIKFFSTPSNEYASRLQRDVMREMRAVILEEGKADAILLATRLAYDGYAVTVRTALGGGSACFRNLRHEFLQVRGSGDYEGLEFIIEPQFREQFEISNPTPHYAELLECVPQLFVGPTARLMPIVQMLCEEMQASFATMGRTLPPWRRTQAMLSKWMPARAKDTPLARSSMGADPAATEAATASEETNIQSSGQSPFAVPLQGASAQGTSPTGSNAWMPRCISRDFDCTQQTTSTAVPTADPVSITPARKLWQKQAPAVLPGVYYNNLATMGESPEASVAFAVLKADQPPLKAPPHHYVLSQHKGQQRQPGNVSGGNNISTAADAFSPFNPCGAPAASEAAGDSHEVSAHGLGLQGASPTRVGLLSAQLPRMHSISMAAGGPISRAVSDSNNGGLALGSIQVVHVDPSEPEGMQLRTIHKVRRASIKDQGTN